MVTALDDFMAQIRADYAARVGPGDVLIMEAHEIHAIDSRRGVHPTYHVHLYGRALAALPSFASRCHEEVG